MVRRVVGKGGEGVAIVARRKSRHAHARQALTAWARRDGVAPNPQRSGRLCPPHTPCTAGNGPA
jgi:hypothetical protein